ncbi:MAG: phospho-N-acetylmuramoyl-pentapeptide-transferase [Actinomycetota bacterium]
MQSILLATAIALVIGLTLTPWVIDLFRARGIGELIREDGPATHFVKHGTPTMGGLVLMIAATLGYLAAHVRIGGGLRVQPLAPSGVMILGVAWILAFIGALDDLAKIRRTRSLGLSKRAKLIGQTAGGFALAFGALNWTGLESRIAWAGTPIDWLPPLPNILFAVWVVFMIVSTSNGVNLTDGVDGLASGSAAMGFFVFTIVAFWEFRNPEVYLQLEPVGRSGLLDVAVASASLLGACIGFLWWNAAPARIIMGDTGALALGGALAALALFTRTHLLLGVIGGLFVIETLSVIIQLIAYRVFDGRRVFAMAPVHHHFELRGWAEFTVIVRFWLVAALTAGLGLALFYTEFLAKGGSG